MPFFEYRQNNSGGGFDVDTAGGIATHVIVEAQDSAHADRRAEEVGLYFDGCSKGLDCDCCGDRWYPHYGSGNLTPSVYGEPIETAKCFFHWTSPMGFVHYLDGRIEAFDLPEER